MARIKALCLVGGGAHDFGTCGTMLVDFLKATDHVAPTLETDMSILADSRLDRFDVLVLHTQGFSITDAQIKGLLGFVKGGKALVGIHCASDSFKNSPEFIDLIGGRFIGHGPVHEFPVTVKTRDHVITRRMADFAITDELYLLDHYDPAKVTVLATAQWNHQEQPMLFAKSFGKGRVVYSALGHGPEAFAHPAFQKIITRAIRWGAGLEEKKPVRAGIVGYGGAFNMGKLHADMINAAGMKAVAVCDLDPARTEQAKQDLPDIKTFNDPEKMLKMKELDMGIIITPHDSHGPLGVLFAENGKHVVSEKPFCITVKEATAIIRAAKKNNVMASVFHNRRWDGDYMAIREAVRKGLIGDVFHVEAYMGHFGRPGNWWRSNKAVCGGAFYDWGAHIVDWVLGLVPGKMVNVTGFFHQDRVWHGITNEDQVQAIVRFESGAVADIQLSSIARIGKPRFRILGTRGAIEDHWGQKSFKMVTEINGVVVNSEVAYKPGGWNDYYNNVADHLLLDEPLEVTAESARRVIAVIELAEQSSAKGEPVPIPYE